MKKTLLCFIWQYGRFDSRDLCTQNGEKIKIVHPGTRNKSAGPDFANATIRIGKNLWKGGIVIHEDGQDWYELHQDSNTDYSNVILNVCFRNVLPIQNLGGHKIPSVELNGKIPADLITDFDKLNTNSAILACQDRLADQDEWTYNALRDKLVTERLESTSLEIYRLLDEVQWDWDIAFTRLLISHFGDGAARSGFKRLSEILDYELLFENSDSEFTVEAIIFGQAGLLDRNFDDAYPKMLQDAFCDYKEAYGLQTLDPYSWQTISCPSGQRISRRLAQIVNIIVRNRSVFNYFLENPEPHKCLAHVSHSFYWDNHIHFDEVSRYNPTTERNEALNDLIIIKVIAPALYAYGKSMSVPDICIHATELLTKAAPEQNRKTALFDSMNLKCRNAADSQAMNQVVNQYCLDKKCLDCPVGCHLFGVSIHEQEESFAAEFEYMYN